MLYKGEINFKGINKDYLSYETTKAMKGICALFIVLHHFTNETVYTGKIFFIFKPIGIYIVAIFFFFSGYGLMYSKKNKPGYMDNFLRRRVCSVLIPYLIVIVIYFVVKYICIRISITEVFTSFFDRWPIVDNSWFIVSILLLYIMFWLFFGVMKKPVLFGIVFDILYVWAIVDYKFIYWSYPIIAFPLGMIWACYKTKIDNFIFKHYRINLIIGLVLTVLFFCGEKIIKISLIHIIVYILAIIFFTLLCMLLFMKVTLKNPIIDFVSAYSFEVYMMHGLFIFLFRRNEFLTANSGIYLFLLLVLTMASSVLLNKVNSFALKPVLAEKSKPKNIKANKIKT